MSRSGAGRVGSAPAGACGETAGGGLHEPWTMVGRGSWGGDGRGPVVSIRVPGPQAYRQSRTHCCDCARSAPPSPTSFCPAPSAFARPPPSQLDGRQSERESMCRARFAPGPLVDRGSTSAPLVRPSIEYEPEAGACRLAPARVSSQPHPVLPTSLDLELPQLGLR
nr:hypothetical protein CFP56_04486 [Quercus suber]